CAISVVPSSTYYRAVLRPQHSAGHVVAPKIPCRHCSRGYKDHKCGPRLRRKDVMATGTVKWFNSEKGYGFIAPDDGSGDVFAHFSAIEGTGHRNLQEDQKVEFDVEQGQKDLQATIVLVVYPLIDAVPGSSGYRYFVCHPRRFLPPRGRPLFLCITTDGRTTEGIRPLSGFEEVTSSVPAQPIV